MFPELKTVEDENIPLRTCIKCGLKAFNDEDLQLFVKGKRSHYGRKNICKSCSNKRKNEHYKNMSEEKKNVARLKVKNWVKNNPERVRENRIEWQRNNKDKLRASRQRYKRKLRYDVLSHYSNGVPKCECCGTEHIEFLTIDHISGGGTKHRQELKYTGTSFYVWLKRNNYPKGYRVLCYNCNCSYFRAGYCPHKKELKH